MADRNNADASFQANSIDCRVIVIGQMEGCVPFDRLLEKDINLKTARKTNEIIDLYSPVWMPFSSGTAGEPKSILHTHRSMFITSLFTINTSSLVCFIEVFRSSRLNWS